MQANTTIEGLIYKKLRQENEEESKKHKKSGKLSAGTLGSPLQHQILSALKAESKKVDDYTLGKFKRGNEVEDFIIKTLGEEVYNTQVECDYRGCVGSLDAKLYGEKWKTPYLPMEVKSITNMAFKWKKKDMKASPGHRLQAGLYALALKVPKFSVLYVASDDYRTLHFIYDTEEIKEEIDSLIDLFNATWKSKTIPVFEAKEKWQSNIMYNSYPFFKDQSEAQLATIAKELFKEK